MWDLFTVAIASCFQNALYSSLCGYPLNTFAPACLPGFVTKFCLYKTDFSAIIAGATDGFQQPSLCPEYSADATIDCAIVYPGPQLSWEPSLDNYAYMF